MAISLHLNYREDNLCDFENYAGDYNEIDEIYLKECRLLKVPNWVCKLSNLIHLSIAKNSLKSIDCVSVLEKLEYLDASDNQIEKIHESCFELVKLKSLDLSGNRITILPDGIENLKELEVLIFDRNDLYELPQSITRCNSIILMAFEYCHNLYKIPANLFNMKNLQHLSLKCCNLNSVPFNISPNLKTLLLKGNRLINNIPYSFNRFLEEDIQVADFFLIEPDDVPGFSERQSKHILSSSANYVDVGNRLINLPTNIFRIYKITDNTSVSLKELTLKAASQIVFQDSLPTLLEICVKNPSGTCDCASVIFNEAFIMGFYDKKRPNFDVIFTQLCCSRICCDVFLRKNLNNIRVLF